MKKPIADITEQEYDKIFAINAKAPFFVMQEALKVMEDNGRIVNLGTSLLAVTTGCTYIENAKTALKAETNIYIRLFCLCRKQSSLRGLFEGGSARGWITWNHCQCSCVSIQNLGEGLTRR